MNEGKIIEQRQGEKLSPFGKLFLQSQYFKKLSAAKALNYIYMWKTVKLPIILKCAAMMDKVQMLP